MKSIDSSNVLNTDSMNLKKCNISTISFGTNSRHVITFSTPAVMKYPLLYSKAKHIMANENQPHNYHRLINPLKYENTKYTIN